MVKLRRVIESELYLESKKDLDDLKSYLGDKLFDDYMKIRDRIPSVSDLNKKYPAFNDKEWNDETEKLFIKKYSNLRKDPIIQKSKEYSDTPNISSISDNNKSRSLSLYSKMRDFVLDTYFTYRDFNKLKKQNKEDVRNFISSYISTGDKKKQDKVEGAEKIYDGDEWMIYKITTYPAAQLYGKGTKWCITGRYPGHEEKGEKYFSDYIKQRSLDDGYYFLINKYDPSYKFCILRYASGGIDSMWNASDDDLVGVSNNEAPRGLLDYIDELPFGDEIEDYLENTAGSDFDVSDALMSELMDPNPNLNRVREYLEELGFSGRLSEDYNLDYFYTAFQHDSSNVETFKELLKHYPPTASYFRNHTLNKECLDALIEDVKKQIEFYKTDMSEDFFDALLQELFISSYDEDHGFFNDKDTIMLLLSNCSDNVLENNRHIYKGMSEALSDNILLDKNFIKMCFDKGLSYREYLFNIQEDSGSYNPRKWNDRVKAGVELGLDLNENIGLSADLTAFYYILMSLLPSVEDVKWYLTHGANPDIKDAYGKTATYYTSDDKIKELFA